MTCDSEIHHALKEMDQLVCDFCGIKFVININQEDFCCEKMDMIKNNGMNVCKNCGVVNSYDLQAPYIDFNKNKFKFKRNQFTFEYIIFLIF